MATRRTFLAGALGSVAFAPAISAQAPSPSTGSLLGGDSDPELDIMAAWVDRFGRPTVKVSLNGAGPFEFLVDTGANTTVVAKRHIESLQVPYTGMAQVYGTTGDRAFPLAILSELVAGSAKRSGLQVAVAEDVDLAREDGILGADVFAGRRLTFDIGGRTVTVESSAHQERRWRRSNMRVRNGHLAEIRGRVGRVGARLMLDTGAGECIINTPLREELAHRYPRLEAIGETSVRGVTGHVLVGDFFELPDLRLGDLVIREAGAVAVDAPVFELWELDEEPAMIVGVNVLSRLDKFTIDYGARLFEATPMAMIARSEWIQA